MKSELDFNMEVQPDNQMNLTMHKPTKGGIYKVYIKKPLDFILSFCAIIILLPFFITVAVLVRLKLGSPVLFKQERSGKNNTKFTMYKFRSMTNKKDENGALLPDAKRITPLGNLLRNYSVDELPQLINILKGEMSFVGPRPYPISYSCLYNERQRHRLDEMPGLTGLAQINGRNGQTWQEKFENDTTYNTNITFLGDITIIFKTALKVLVREGINEFGETTATDFMGNEQAELITLLGGQECASVSDCSTS